MSLRRARRVLLSGLLFGLGFPASRSAAQTASVLVRDGPGGPPVAGAIVRLLQGDSVLAQGLTSEFGRVTLRAGAAGRFLLRVSRIGYDIGTATPIDLAAGETRPVELAERWNQIFLPEIIVEGKSPCGKATDERALAATLWDQIRQALTATSLSERSELTLHSRTVDRGLSAGGAVQEEHVSSPRVTGSRPFVPLPPERLAELGYVRVDADSVVYSAPDAESLLADPFVATHCFGIRTGPKDDSLKLGLTFEPLKTRRTADIRGVLWVDRHSLELRTLEFHYVSSTQSILESNAWGRLEFARLSSGAWYIRSWFIRMPEIVRTLVRTTFHDAVSGFREHGGTAEPLKPGASGAVERPVADSPGVVADVDSAQRLPELKTTAPLSPSARFQRELRDRMQRNGAPMSALITRDELEKSKRFRLAGLLVVHGLKSRVNKYGKETLTCPRTTDRPAVFVDGLLVDGSDSPNAKRFRFGLINEMFDMENLTPEDVEAVEVYRSPGEWPAQFTRTEASCLVVIWTRRGEKQP